jgi:hypothetical protein
MTDLDKGWCLWCQRIGINSNDDERTSGTSRPLMTSSVSASQGHQETKVIEA